MHNDASILIPTFNRPHYLKRLLDYYSSFRTRYDIIIMDSSSSDARKINDKTAHSFNNLNIKYIDSYPFGISPNLKISSALNKVKNKYCVICADDDFTTPNSISKSVSFLEKNPDFMASHGSYISFYLRQGWKGKKEFWWRPIYPYESVTSSDAKTRLVEHFSNYYPIFYAVNRSKFLRMVFNEQKNYTSDTRFGELLTSMLALIHGKMKKLDMLSTARSAQSIPMVKNMRYFLYFEDFRKEGTYQQKYTSFRKCLAKHLRKKASLSWEESNKVIDKCMLAYTNRFESIHKTKMHQLKNALDELRLPVFIDKKIRALYRKVFIPELTNRLPQKYHDDIGKIRHYALLHSKYAKN